MNKITVTATLLQGNDDATLNIFNDDVSYTHYFSAVNPGPWVLALNPGNYLVGIVGTVAPGGSVTIDLNGITSANPALSQKFSTPGKFIQGVAIVV